MNKSYKFIMLGSLLAILILAAVSPVQAAGLSNPSGEGKVVFGGNYTLGSGETLDGDLAILGGNAEIQDGATVNGGTFLAGGNLTVDGSIQGDVVILGGNISMGDTAVVSGDVNAIGGSINRAAGAQILGQVITSERPLDLALPHSLLTPRYNMNFDPILSAFGWFAKALALAALAMIVAMLAPNPTNRVASAAVTQPVPSGGIGLLTLIIAPFVLLLMAITLIGIPVALLAIMALVVAVTFGWIALGLELGRRMARMFNASWSLPLAAGLGTFVLSLVANGVGFIPCVGWLAPFLVSILGLGAVILTRFGTRPYPLNVLVPPVSPYQPAAPRVQSVNPAPAPVTVYPAPEPAEPPQSPESPVDPGQPPVL